MLELAHPWLLLLLLLPPFIYRFAPAYREKRDALQVPFFTRLIEVSGKFPSRAAVKLERSRQQRILLALGWLSLVLAMAKPEWVGEPVVQERAAREIMVALDLSGSMSEEDFVDVEGRPINRLQAAKLVLGDFARQRSKDRLGLILFGDAAYLQAPFTEDIDTWLSLLNETQLGIAGWQTAIGDAIGLSITAFGEDTERSRVLILLSDGYDTGSRMPPIKAAEIAQAKKIRIYTIAMGDPTIDSEYKLDTETLKGIAESTGGQSYQAINQEKLREAYRKISELEKQLYESVSFRPRTSLHQLPFAAYIIINLIALLPALIARMHTVTNTKREPALQGKGSI